MVLVLSFANYREMRNMVGSISVYKISNNLSLTVSEIRAMMPRTVELLSLWLWGWFILVILIVCIIYDWSLWCILSFVIIFRIQYSDLFMIWKVKRKEHLKKKDHSGNLSFINYSSCYIMKASSSIGNYLLQLLLISLCVKNNNKGFRKGNFFIQPQQSSEWNTSTTFYCHTFIIIIYTLLKAANTMGRFT